MGRKTRSRGRKLLKLRRTERGRHRKSRARRFGWRARKGRGAHGTFRWRTRQSRGAHGTFRWRARQSRGAHGTFRWRARKGTSPPKNLATSGEVERFASTSPGVPDAQDAKSTNSASGRHQEEPRFPLWRAGSPRGAPGMRTVARRAPVAHTSPKRRLREPLLRIPVPREGSGSPCYAYQSQEKAPGALATHTSPKRGLREPLLRIPVPREGSGSPGCEYSLSEEAPGTPHRELQCVTAAPSTSPAEFRRRWLAPGKADSACCRGWLTFVLDEMKFAPATESTRKPLADGNARSKSEPLTQAMSLATAAQVPRAPTLRHGSLDR
jgi:hypothetical protein